MKKSKSIVALLLVLILTAGVGYTVLFGIGDRGKAEYIKRGLDLQGGVSITYEVADDDFSDEDFSDTKRKMELRAYDFSEEAEVYQEGDNRITVDIPGEDDAEAVLADLGKPGALQFITYTGEEDDPDTEDDESIKVWLDGSDIKDAQPSTSTDKTTSTTEYVVKEQRSLQKQQQRMLVKSYTLCMTVRLSAARLCRMQLQAVKQRLTVCLIMMKQTVWHLRFVLVP
jgi:SecD/SecF fusion protein